MFIRGDLFVFVSLSKSVCLEVEIWLTTPALRTDLHTANISYKSIHQSIYRSSYWSIDLTSCWSFIFSSVLLIHSLCIFLSVLYAHTHTHTHRFLSCSCVRTLNSLLSTSASTARSKKRGSWRCVCVHVCACAHMCERKGNERGRRERKVMLIYHMMQERNRLSFRGSPCHRWQSMTGPGTGLSQRQEPKRGGSTGNEYGIPHIANDREM